MLRGLATARRAVASSSAVRPETPRLPAGDAAAVRPVASTRKFGAAASSFSQVVGPFIAGSRKTQVAVLVLRNRAAAAVHLASLALLRQDYRRIDRPPPVPSPCPADESDLAETPKKLDSRPGLDCAWVRRRQLGHLRRVVLGWLISEPEYVSSRSTSRELGFLGLHRQSSTSTLASGVLSALLYCRLSFIKRQLTPNPIKW